ncbi:MarR family transcriptional regulator [Paracoccus sp. M683]|uniref:MarR family winged helix-turn-helix transcriptional regulator n=1 Tax=Paracoccus sp. M683 TaxID=2594268 RepID=UPI00118108D1|nr:MarR family transcriptional regulator [Paracoccus sp. M683]TRW99223.1 MarR family transcriptional regulator [Paracoccus sp. M683]
MTSTSDLTELPGHLIRRLNQRSTAIFQDRMKEAGHDLTSVQFAALDMLNLHPGTDQAGLATMIAYDRATIGGVVQRLEQKGLVARQIDENDRRARRLTLTPAGHKLLMQLSPMVAALQAEILGNLSDAERAQFINLAKRAIMG